MGSAQNGQGVNCDGVVTGEVVVVVVGAVADSAVGKSKIMIRAKIPRTSPPHTHPKTLRFLLEAAIPQKMGQKINHNKTNMTSILTPPNLFEPQHLNNGPSHYSF